MVKGGICVMGSFVVDLTSRAPHLPVKGETVIGTLFRMGPGGKGSNQGVAARRAGGNVTMITKVGKDVFGNIAIENFKKEGLYSKYIFEDPENPTGTALIMVDDESANSILVVSGACGNLTPDEIDSCREVLADSQLLLTQLEVNMSATERMIEMAHELDVTVVLNTAPVQAVSDRLLSMVDIVTPNEVEAAIIAGLDEVRTMGDYRRAADYFFSKGVKYVVITLGKNGAYCSDGKNEACIPILPTEAVDTTGAGDAFNGGFVTALSEGRGFFDAAVFGSVTAGISATRFGTAPSMPTRSEIDEYAASYNMLFEINELRKDDPRKNTIPH